MRGENPTMLLDSSEWRMGSFGRYYRELLAFLTAKLRCPEQAADLTQETFARVCALPDPTAIRQPRALLYRIARNLAVDLTRQQSVQFRHMVLGLDQYEEAPSPTRQPDQIAEAVELRSALEQTIADMPPRRREVFKLYRFGDLTQAEIAERLGISLTMVERHLMKAMAHCRRSLEPFN